MTDMADIEHSPAFLGSYSSVRDLMSTAFGFEWPEPSGDPYSRLFEPGRSLAGYDGDDLVGHAGALSIAQRVPGARWPPRASRCARCRRPTGGAGCSAR